MSRADLCTNVLVGGFHLLVEHSDLDVHILCIIASNINMESQYVCCYIRHIEHTDDERKAPVTLMHWNGESRFNLGLNTAEIADHIEKILQGKVVQNKIFYRKVG